MALLIHPPRNVPNTEALTTINFANGTQQPRGTAGEEASVSAHYSAGITHFWATN